MSGISHGFSDFGGRVWINCSHQGALPLAAAEAAREAVQWKLSPVEMTTARFVEVPRRLRELLADLISAEEEDIVLANGASYGVHLLANGLPLDDGDEVVVMKGDFPSNVLPWLGLEPKGVRCRLIRPAVGLPTVDEVAQHLSDRTRVLCLSWVHSFSGYVADLETIGALCRSRDIHFIVNTTQGLGARGLDVSRTPVDAIVNAGWKWLCGPYATGFCWMRPEIRRSLTLNQAYWQTLFTADDLGNPDLDLHVPDGDDPRRFDLFAQANFFNYVPWTAALELLRERGYKAIEVHDQDLVQRLLDGIDRSQFEILSPEDRERRSTLVFVSHHDPSRNAAIYEALREDGIDIAHRAGKLRFAPHFYNTEEHIDRALEALRQAADRS